MLKLSLSHLALSRRLKRTKRLLVNRRGDGVHSPFAFQLIHRVIRSRRPYYCFEELRAVLRQQRSALSYEAMHQARSLELVYRLLQELRPRAVYYRAAERSMLPSYLEHSGLHHSPLSEVHRPEAASCVLLEGLPREGEALEQLAERLIALRAQDSRLMLFVYHRGRRQRLDAGGLRQRLSPQLVLDLIDMELWFCDPSLTPCRYKAVY